jgi:hypothetical protein
MHNEILTEEQKELLNLVKKFHSQFGLVGETAIALHLGHRRSVVFDLFTQNDFDIDIVRAKIRESHKIQQTLVSLPNQLTIFVESVKLTFYKYPFDIEYPINFENSVNIPDLVTLGAMKAFALGIRAKWKDYVDLFFIFKDHDIEKICIKAEELFGSEFNQKLFREQLSYFNDIDYTEKVEYLNEFEVPDKYVEDFLTKVSLQK